MATFFQQIRSNIRTKDEMLDRVIMWRAKRYSFSGSRKTWAVMSESKRKNKDYSWLLPYNNTHQIKLTKQQAAALLEELSKQPSSGLYEYTLKPA